MQQQNDIIKDITEIRLVNLDEKLQEEERSRLALEVWGCKWNLVIRGIEGSTNESPVVTEEKVRAFLSRDLNLNKRECRDFNDIARCFTQMHKSIFEKIISIENRTKTLEDKAIFIRRES